MTSRTPACEDETVGRRIAELRAERDAALRGAAPEPEPNPEPECSCKSERDAHGNECRSWSPGCGVHGVKPPDLSAECAA